MPKFVELFTQIDYACNKNGVFMFGIVRQVSGNLQAIQITDFLVDMSIDRNFVNG